MRAYLAAALAAGLMALGCGTEEELPEVDCTQTIPRFAELRIGPYCTSCHASGITGAARMVPTGLNYDNYSDAVVHAEAGAHVVSEGEMPPAGAMVPQDIKDEFYLWALCGTPQ